MKNNPAVRAARIAAVTLAAVVVLVLGLPAVLGWVPLPVDDAASGVPRGSLVVVEPVDPAHQVTAPDAVTVVTSTGALVTRTLRAVDAGTLTLSTAGATTTQVDRSRLRAVERYRIPVVGHLVAAVPAAQRPWWGRVAAILFLTWAAAELWSALRARRAEGTAGRAALGAAPAPRAITAARSGRPGAAGDAAAATGSTSVSAGSAMPTRRQRAQARHATPWSRLTDMAASAVGAVVMAMRTLDHRHEDPADGRGRHRSGLPTTTVDTSHVDRAPTAPQGSTVAQDGAGHQDTAGRPATAVTGRTRRAAIAAAPGPAAGRHTAAPGTTNTEDGGTTTHDAPTTRAGRRGATATPPLPTSGQDPDAARWAPRPSQEEVARAARIQDFEARRAAAEASLLHDIPPSADLSPVDRLLGEREARRDAASGARSRTDDDA